MRTFRDSMGRVMVEEPAGGTGGSPVTSMATRPATDPEIMAFHVEEVANAKAAMEAADAAHKEAVDAHAKHVALQPPVIGAPPPPGPLDRSSVTAQGVSDPGADDPHGRLGVPVGGHTEDQGQPTQPVEHGTRPPSPPAATMPSAPTPPAHNFEQAQNDARINPPMQNQNASQTRPNPPQPNPPGV